MFMSQVAPTPASPSDAGLDALRKQASALSASELMPLVRADQRQRWLRGERPLVEGYLGRLSQLQNGGDWLFDLIFSEILLREERGEKPSLDEYLGRFPLHQSRLRRQFTLHKAVDWDSLLGPPPAEVPAPDPNAKTLCGDDATPTPAVCRPSVPGYIILEELGRGGMGVVYKAWHENLKRPVALKMILVGDQASDEHRARFRVEAEAVARLQHPGIVQIYDIGEHQGRPYLAFEYVGGGSLDARLACKPLPSREAAALVEALARAMHFAHQRDVVHRDLKPANILLAEHESPDDGRPTSVTGQLLNRWAMTVKITDFGLAKQLDDDSGRTQCGDVIGTPSYMAPEQATARNDAVGPRTDVWSLGAILYESLTGRPPFCGETPQLTVNQVAEQDPVPPRLMNTRVDRDVEVICLKCLEKSPSDRYTSAEELAEDLARYRRGEPIQARSLNLLDRLVRAVGRSQDDAEFYAWGPMLLWFGVILFIAQTSVAALLAFAPPDHTFGWILGIRAVQFSVMFAVFYRFRTPAVLPRSAAERQLWAIWLGYFAATAIIVLSNNQLARLGKISDDLAFYPLWSALSGLSFFVMGSSYWGRLYVVGGAFFVLALLMPFQLAWAPLEFGIVWAASLVGISLHLKHLQQRTREEPVSRVTPGPAELKPRIGRSRPDVS
jgi:serine/threonine protein kinase